MTALLLLVTFSHVAVAAENISRRSFCGNVFKFAKYALVAAYLPDSVLTVSRVGRGNNIGHRVIFNMQSVLDTLSAKERAEVDGYVSAGDELAIARFYSKRLSGAYEDSTKNEWWWNFFKPSRDASEFLNENCSNRGVCRHKAAVLAAILQYYGIANSLEVGAVASRNGERSLHAWVKIRLKDGEELIVDPTLDTVSSVEEYYKDVEPSSIINWLYSIAPTGVFY